MRPRLTTGLLVALTAAIFTVALLVSWRSAGRVEERVETLDLAKIIVLRTPGGMLEVATLEKVEEFSWKAQYKCPLINCSLVLTPAVSKVRVPVHYAYRIPLADTWELKLNGEQYDLLVPAPQAKTPVAFDTSKLQVESTRGWLSPTKRSNEQALMRQLGPELDRRAENVENLRAVQSAAQQSVRDFASKWMQEQGYSTSKPVRVHFREAQ